MLTILLILLIIILLRICYTIENFIIPNVEDDKLLTKCFDTSDINSFKQYYGNANVIKIKDSVIFSTPNNIIKGIPQLSWNGVFLNNLCVDPKIRNKGIGTKLVLKVIDNAKKEGKDHIILQVANTNVNAIKIYNKCGFKKHMEGMNEKGKYTSIYVLYL
jgi:ribosomal protein S18 acetylase RimI-like enzyme